MDPVSRAGRLLELMQVLRRHRQPVSGAALADALGISLRTRCRDIASLQAQGASIDGTPGLGYVLRPGFLLPPLMFGAEEIEALVLGSRWVAGRDDHRLGAAARNALAKIAAVLPPGLCHELESAALLVGPGAAMAAGDAEIIAIRMVLDAAALCVVTSALSTARSPTPPTSSENPLPAGRNGTIRWARSARAHRKRSSWQRSGYAMVPGQALLAWWLPQALTAN